jgi:hypothetical protein
VEVEVVAFLSDQDILLIDLLTLYRMDMRVHKCNLRVNLDFSKDSWVI